MDGQQVALKILGNGAEKLMQAVALPGSDMQRRIATAPQSQEIRPRHVINKDMVAHLMNRAAQRWAAIFSQHRNTMGYRVLRSCIVCLSIDRGVAQNGIIEAILLREITHIGLSGDFTDIKRGGRTQRCILSGYMNIFVSVRTEAIE